MPMCVQATTRAGDTRRIIRLGATATVLIGVCCCAGATGCARYGDERVAFGARGVAVSPSGFGAMAAADSPDRRRSRSSASMASAADE